ncbi:hypothetical protein BV898_19290 [Hypsibius exemplaris]|uniref:NADPH-dependent FMN reductase-like domain-containing protein n=1 Tax=Hypsibius exemplaris TaxID=2072580 RepID=A0A9X6NKL3_HYPEX|nr:hypothetical protein BV898_19290 [Hypsibius exemplaris]
MAPLAAAGLHFILFLGSVRENRNADRVKNYLVNSLAKYNVSVTVFDPRELNYTKVIQPLHYYEKPEDAPERLRNLSDVIRKADGHIVVTPEYHSAIPPSLTTMMDQFPPASYAFRPAAIVSYSKGRFGGIRAATHLRTWLSELSLVHIPSVLAIPKVEEAITKEGKTTNKLVLESTDALLGELVWFARAIKTHAQVRPLQYKGKAHFGGDKLSSG